MVSKKGGKKGFRPRGGKRIRSADAKRAAAAKVRDARRRAQERDDRDER